MRRDFAEIAKEILENLDRWTTELRDVKDDSSLFIKALHKKINDHLKHHGYSLANLKEDNRVLDAFEKHKLLKDILAYDQSLAAQARAASTTDPVAELAKKIFTRRDQFWKLAQLFASEVPEGAGEIEDKEALTSIIFSKIIGNYLKKKGMSFEVIEANPEAKTFFSSGRLLMAAKIHKMRVAQKAAGAAEARAGAKEPGFRLDRANPAHRAALRDAEAGSGLFTRAGVTAEDDEAALDRKIRQVLLAHHPDKRPGGSVDEDDRAICDAAIELRQLLKARQLPTYLEAYRALKAREDVDMDAKAEAKAPPKPPGPG